MGGVDPFRKGLSDIIKSIPLVAKEYNDVLFILTGGENVKRVQIECEKINISKYVYFWGWVKADEKIKLYNSVDMLLLPSYNEGLPYVVIEALAAGLPIVTTDIGGIPEIVENGKNGYIIKPGDYRAMAKKIIILSKNKSLKYKISKENSQKAQRKYSLEAVMEKITDIYHELV